MPPFHHPRQVLLEAVRARVTPCAVAEVGDRSGPLWRDAVGTLEYAADAPAATEATVFDLASLTKIVATTTLAMRSTESGWLRLDAPLREYLSGWRANDRADVTIADLLEHAAGLPAVIPIYERHAGREAIERAICDAPLDYPPRTRSIYSDPGFILLGFVLADAAGSPLDAQFDEVVRSLSFAGGADLLRYGPIPGTSAVAPTQIDSWRGRLLRGEVDDRNGAALNGVAGHAGLFGTAAAVGRFARSVLRGYHGDAAGVPAATATIRRFLTRSRVPGSSRALGWDTMLPGSSCGSLMSADAFGHTGFTGTSLWLDPRADVYVVLLTNRVHPKAGGSEGIQATRRAFHDAVMEELSGGIKRG
jgi:CubicO group peptidase (beta-lactamase class C family)